LAFQLVVLVFDISVVLVYCFVSKLSSKWLLRPPLKRPKLMCRMGNS